MIDGICIVVYLGGFDRFDPLVLVLYGYVFMFLECPKKLIMRCPNILVAMLT